MTLNRWSETKIGFLSFADGNRSTKMAGMRLEKQIRKAGVSYKTKVYSEKDLRNLLNRKDRNFLDQNKSVRGFGYWLWKPLIIIDFLKRNPELEILIYLDAGCEFHFSNNSASNFNQYIQGALEHGICAFSTQNDRAYTKRFTVEFFDLPLPLLLLPQIQSGILIFRSDAVNSICPKWLDTMRFQDYENLIDKRDELLESIDFIEHRHDQSVLSMLLKSTNIGKIYPAREHTWPHERNLFLKNSPFWAVRNMSRIPLRYQKYWNPLYVLENFALKLISKLNES